MEKPLPLFPNTKRDDTFSKAEILLNDAAKGDAIGPRKRKRLTT